jgi:hypothetical protein
VTHVDRDIRTAAPGEPAELVRWEQRYLKWLYWAGAAGLAPWIVYLYLVQVPSAPTHQVHILAIGLIAAMMAGIGTTAWAYWRGLAPAVIAASFTATAAFISAWFRATTHSSGSNWSGSVPVFCIVAAAIVALCVTVVRQIRRELPAPAAGRVRARWLPAALLAAALALVPSIVVVLTVVPQVQIAHHLPLAWTGLDVCEFLALGATGFALHRRAACTSVPATITGALLLCDAWINIIPTTGMARAEAIVLAFVEVPMAALSFWIAARSVRRPRPRPGLADAGHDPADLGAVRQ